MSIFHRPLRLSRLAALVALSAVLHMATATNGLAQFVAQQVGGVSIDAKGVVSKVRVDELGELQRVRQQAFQPVPGDLKAMTLRKISLRQLEAAIAEHRQNGTPLTDDMRYLAGLQRIQYVFVYPEQNDIVLAGPGEGWRISPDGEIVGQSTNRPVMLLDDLLVALRASDALQHTGISCSIDPTQEGLARYQTLLKTLGTAPDDPRPLMEAMEKSLGPQTITVTGVPDVSHFARVLVAADYRMKRIAMAFEESPVKGLTDYLRMVKSGGKGQPAMPRWWLAADFDSLLTDPSGLSWELKKASVKAMTEDEFISANGQRKATGHANPTAQKWADNMTAHYDALSAKDSIFGQLRNCMDLAVVTALIAKENLTEKCGWSMPLLLNPDLKSVSFNAPHTVDTQASVVQRRGGTVFSASGGVQINPWQCLEKPSTSPELGETRVKSAAHTTTWWWN